MKKLMFLLTCILLAGFTAPMDAKTIKDKTLINASYQGVKTIRVNASVYKINITKGNSQKTAVKCVVEETTLDLEEFEVKTRQEGSVLEVYQVPNNDGYSRSMSKGYKKNRFNGYLKGYINIAVPAGVEVVTVHGSSKDVNVSGLGLDSLTVSAVSGDIRVGDIVTPNLSVKASSGDVTIERSRGAQLNVSTVSGDVGVSGADFATLNMRSSSGDVTVSIVPKARTASFTTISGDLEISGVKAADGFSVKTSSGSTSISNCSAGPKSEITSISGDVKIDGMSGDIFTLKTSSGTVYMANVRGNQMSLASISGNIQVRSSDFVSVNTSSSSGSLALYMGAKLKQVALKTISGGISLYLKGDLKDNRYDLRGISGTFSIQGFAKAQKTFLIDSGKGLVDIKGETSSGNITVKNW